MARGMKGTASDNKLMVNMNTYGGQESPGYKPPSGSAGKAAKGVYSNPDNPMSVPMKGSQIGPGYGNADTMKAKRNQSEQLRAENLRGQAC